MKFATETGVTIEIPENASDLTVYRACRAAGLLKNQTFSALTFDCSEREILIDRTRDQYPLLTLDRIDIDITV